MLPGFRSFMPVRKGQAVARTRAARFAAGRRLMLMPYQGQGEDGYFLAHGVPFTPLGVAAPSPLDRLVPLLPGVRRHPCEPDRFLVDPAVARWQVVNVFHLFGYRHIREAGDRLVFSRRRPGFRRLEALPPELARFSAGPR
jgi:hypothetical protein